MKYGVYGMGIVAICATFAFLPTSRADDIPQIIAFRAYGIYYLFPIMIMAALSLPWRLILFSGAIAGLAWWAALLIVAADMPQTLSWGDIPTDATRADYETIFLSIDFIGRGNCIEETGMPLAGAMILALAVY